MIENSIIGKIIVMVLSVIVVFILGVVYGQHSVWVHLRKKGHVTTDEWFYTAVKSKEGQYKRWE